MLIGTAVAALIAAGVVIGLLWPTRKDQESATMQDRVKAVCEGIDVRPWVMRECIAPANAEKVAWMLGHIDTFCEGHAADTSCLSTQHDALVRLYNFKRENPRINAEDCMRESRDEHGRPDLDKTYFCLVAAKATGQGSR